MIELDYPQIVGNLSEALNEIPTSIYLPDINDWSEENRMIPAGISPKPGMHSRFTAPYMIEILEQLHPDNPVTHISIMKSVQSGATHHAECAMAYYIAYRLGNIGYYTANQRLGRDRSSGNIDPLIDCCNLGDRVKPISQRNARKKADSVYYKEFDGGIRLIIGSYNSPGSLKSLTLQFIIMDEIDEAPAEIPNQGDTISILEGRTFAVANPKILALSTPGKEGNSRIHNLYMEANQCKYEVPCPYCNCFQVLELKRSGSKYGLTFRTETIAGQRKLIPESVGYICYGCSRYIRGSQKQDMLLAGRWKESNPGASPRKKSYHVTGLMVNEALHPWRKICQAFIESDFGEDISKFKNFSINSLGRPWIITDKAYNWQNLKRKSQKYQLGTIPDEATPLLFGGADVQKDRIECVIIAIGPGFDKWVIDHQVFHGSTQSVDNPVWRSFKDFGLRHQYEYRERPYSVYAFSVDTGWNPSGGDLHTVHAFCDNICFIPTRGVIGRGGKNKEDLFKPQVKGKPLGLNSFMLKDDLFRCMPETHGKGLFHVPRFRAERMSNGNRWVLPDSFYQGICSEELQMDEKKEYHWVNLYNNNEILDCIIYAIGLSCSKGVHRWTSEDWRRQLGSINGNEK